MASGSANITTAPGFVTINQSSHTAILNWQSFSINSGEITRFQVPNFSAATLNRVTGGNASQIYGTLQSNGQVYLLNPNGILVGPSGRINTAGFVGSTLNITDAQFNQRQNLNFFGTSDAAVNNQGTISAQNGDVYLIATQVENSGAIAATRGTVGLAASKQVLLQNAGDQHLFVQSSPSTAGSQATGIQNSGSISAAAAELRAAGGNAYALAINNSGNISATGIARVHGQIYLTSPGGDLSNSGTIRATKVNGDGGLVVLDAHSTLGETTTGTLQDSGKIVASGTRLKNNVGGTVHLLGDQVGLTGNTVVDVSGEAGGGTALVGGAEHGKDPAIPNARQTYLGAGASIRADALSKGQGGNVILWASDTTQVYGQLSVRGGAAGGNGGLVETSGGYLDARSVPDLAATHGKGGRWLLDPYDVDIIATGASTTTSSSGGGDTEFNANPPTTVSTLTVGDIKTALANGTVGINAEGDSDSNITWEPGANLYYGSIAAGNLALTMTASGVISISGVTIANVASGNATSTSLDLNIYPGVLRVSNSTIDLHGGSLNVVAFADPDNVTVDFAASTSAADVDIESSTIRTGGEGSIEIQGTGIAGAGMDALGVQIDNSTLALGTSTAPASGSFEIQGSSDNGTTSTQPTLEPSAPSAYGLRITDNSQLTDYGSGSSGSFHLAGQAYAANNSAAIGLLIEGSTVAGYSEKLSIKGSVGAENVNGNPSGFANQVAGVALTDGALVENFGVSSHVTGVTISGSSTMATTASDGGDLSVTPENVGVVIAGNSQVTASGDTTFLSVPIAILGNSGSAQTSTGNPNPAVSSGVIIFGNSNAGTSTISNSGLGATAIAGLGGTSTGANVISDGVDILGGSNSAQDVVEATGGGSIGVAGLGGILHPDPNATSFAGQADGVAIGSFETAINGTRVTSGPATLATESGSIFLLAAAGALEGTQPGSTSLDLTGLELNSATLSTDTATPAGAPAVPGGGVVPPLILIYATDSTVTSRDGPITFQLGSEAGYAIKENSTSSLVTENLVLGNYYDALTADAPAADVAKIPSFASFNNFLTKNAGYINDHDVTINPAGQISLTSVTNKISNLDSALVGPGGLDLNDNVNLTVDPIGSSDNLNYGMIDEPAMGPVTIQTTGNLTLTAVSPLTHKTTSGAIIATNGTGNNITLITGGVFTNLDNNATPALVATGGAVYDVYSNDVIADRDGNLANFKTLFNTYYTGTSPGTGDFLVFTGGPGAVNTTTPPALLFHGGVDDPGDPTNLSRPVQNALVNIPYPNTGGLDILIGSFDDPLNWDPTIVGDAGGVDIDGLTPVVLARMRARLALLYSPRRAAEMLQIIINDFRDGSPNNTGTLTEKWVANSGLNETVRSGEFAGLTFGETMPIHPGNLILDEFQSVSGDDELSLLSKAAFGRKRSHD